MPQLEHIEAIERRLWSAADTLRANSNDASNEYLPTQFADQKAHDGGEFFTPVSLVSLIAHVLDPKRGIVLDPACGSGGMFVPSARTVPCELWLDARNLYRKVTRRIYDFSPEQERNLLAIVWLYRGDRERFLGLLSEYLARVVHEAQACFERETGNGETRTPLADDTQALASRSWSFATSAREQAALSE